MRVEFSKQYMKKLNDWTVSKGEIRVIEQTAGLEEKAELKGVA